MTAAAAPLTPAQQATVLAGMRIVSGVLKRYPIHRNDRADVYQDGYLALCEIARTGAEGDEFEKQAWAAVRNRVFDHYRRAAARRRKMAVVQPPEPTPEPLAAMVDAEAAADASAIVGVTLDRMDRLDARQRDIINRVYGITGPTESMATIAERLGVSGATVRKLRNNALLLLIG